MANTNKKTERQMIAVKMKDQDYEYLKQVLALSNISLTSAATDLLSGLATLFRNVIGEDLEKIDSKKEEFYLRNLVKFSLLQMASVLDTENPLGTVLSSKASQK